MKVRCPFCQSGNVVLVPRWDFKDTEVTVPHCGCQPSFVLGGNVPLSALHELWAPGA